MSVARHGWFEKIHVANTKRFSRQIVGGVALVHGQARNRGGFYPRAGGVWSKVGPRDLGVLKLLSKSAWNFHRV
jgi:hypothetical protein